MPSRAPLRSSWFRCVANQSPQKRALSTAIPQLQRRAVAGSFIFKFPHNDTTQRPQVALFRRSGAVKTYPHKYAPISGSVEPSDASPLATAWREIHEETSLTSTSLRLFRHGKPYAFADPSVGREWAINPFAFVLAPAAEAGIRLDWEHEGYDWFDPDDVSASQTFGGVPRLLDSFRRVWFDIDLGKDAGRVLGEGLLLLRQGDARQLAANALDIFTDVIPRLDTGDRDAWWRNVRFAGWHLWKNGHESIGVLGAVVSALAMIEQKLPSSALSPGFVHGVVGDIKDFAQGRRNSSSKPLTEAAEDVTQKADGFFSDL